MELSSEARRLTGPLFWLHGDESKEHLEYYIEKVAEGGNGSFIAESRPHIDWLGEGWYRDLQICLEAAKKHDLQMWIFDEEWWPSGEVGGRVPQQFGSKYMQAQAVEVNGPVHYAGVAPHENHIATLAGRATENEIDGDSLTDLTALVNDGKLAWDVPSGRWMIMHFTWRYSEGRRGRLLVDGASRDAIQWYLDTVYQPHYDRFKEDFGTRIKGFFYDEPETYGDWGTEVIPMLKTRGVNWKKALTAWKFSLAGHEQAAAKYQYQDALAEAWGQTMFGGITQWCRQRGVRSIGHFLEHKMGYLNPKWCAGNMFQLQKYSDMGGIDAVFTQFVMGRRIARDSSTWQTPKLGSSISHVYGKDDDVAMVEIFGARGQDLTYPEMKWWTDHMHVSGINFHVPHSFNPRSPFDRDCPPYFYNGGFEPRWPLYRVYADYTSRLSMMLSGGYHVCPVALLFVGNSYHVGKSIPPEQMSEVLQDTLYDCDWMPYDVFEEDAELKGEQITLHQERYRILIVPPVEVIPYKTLHKAKQFFESGGTVIGYGFLPSKAAEIGRTPQEVADLCRSIWDNPRVGLTVCKISAAGGRSYFLPDKPTPQQLQQVFADAGIRPTLEVLEGETDNWLHVLHRVREDRDIFFVTNQNVDNNPRTFKFRITAAGFPECWDPMRAEITAVPFVRRGRTVEMSLTMEPSESVLLVFAPEKRSLPRRIEAGGLRAAERITVSRIPSPPTENAEDEAVTDSASLADSSWVWNPEQNALNAPPGTCYFRKSFNLPADRTVAQARFVGTADNRMKLIINGTAILDGQPSFGDWKRVADSDIAPALRAGRNVAAISVQNFGTQPNSAGLIGKLGITFEDQSRIVIPIDASWKTSTGLQSGWEMPDFDDSIWIHAKAFAAYPAAPWGSLTEQNRTFSPIKKADPFDGTFDLPSNFGEMRIVLEMDNLVPEAAVRIIVNGQCAGGFIDRPLRKDISVRVKTGLNTFRIEPFSPEKVWIAVYPR